jgi:tRNA (guanine-N7-)-methyltransferase
MQAELAAAQLPNLIYQPPSYVERLSWSAVFPRPLPVEVELGSGDGTFLAEWARRHPEHNFLGVERLLGRLRKLDRKGRRAGLTNLRALRIEAMYFLEYLLPPGTVPALHVYFPDPWPKRRHWRRRLINAQFVALAAQVLAPAGRVFLRTDDADYHAQMVREFSASSGFRAIETPGDLAALATDFERDFQQQGVTTRRAAYQRQ